MIMANPRGTSIEFWRAHLVRALDEDNATFDFTSQSLPDPTRIIEIEIRSKSTGIFVGEGAVRAAADLYLNIQSNQNIDAEFLTHLKDGAAIEIGTLISSWKGEAASLLQLERAVLNLIQWVSGIATQTRELFDAIQSVNLAAPPRLTPTRKTLPFYRDISLYAVACGGGIPHRTSLSGGVLIKENHIAAAGSIQAALQKARKIAPHGLKIEVEVRDLKELEQAIEAEADVIMLDNFERELLSRALIILSERAPRTLVEVSGSIRRENIVNYVLPGVHVISSGSLTHSVTSLDFTALVKGF